MPPVETVIALLAALAGAAPAAAEEHSKLDTFVTSHDGTPVGVTVFRPADAGAAAPVPMILHSHGWGGSRSTAISAFQTELDAGFGVLSFDQRGFGQTPGALTEIRETGRTRFNGLSPEITWLDLAESLAPARVARSAWIALLYAGGPRAHRQDIHVHTDSLDPETMLTASAAPGLPDATVTTSGAGAPQHLELASVAADVPAGQKLYLTITPVPDLYVGHGSARTPGVVTLENLTVTLPVR